MEQNKELEEMRRLILDKWYDCDRNNGIDSCTYCEMKSKQKGCILAEKIAEQLYNAGYAKFDRAEWVKREYFDKVVEENKNLKQSLENDFTFETTNGGKMNVLDMVKKQAVKEFAEKLKSNEVYLPYCEIKVVNTEYIDDLLKEYGVEL